MQHLHRHQLVRLHEEGWQRILAREWDAEACACLTHWALHCLPLVVTRQAATLPDDALALGLAAPAQWSRRRLALQVRHTDVLYSYEFPRAGAIEGHLPVDIREPWRTLCAALNGAGATARVYGSHGWQQLTGLRYLHPGSDIDLWLAVGSAAQADRASALLSAFEAAGRPRIDGELLFRDGTACAWREWQAWRAGRCARLLTKGLGGAVLVERLPAAEADMEALLP